MRALVKYRGDNNVCNTRFYMNFAWFEKSYFSYHLRAPKNWVKLVKLLILGSGVRGRPHSEHRGVGQLDGRGGLEGWSCRSLIFIP